MKKRMTIPVGLTLATGVNGLATYFAAAGGDVSQSIVARLDKIIDTGALLQLMSIALTAGALVLAVWGMIAPQKNALVASLPKFNDQDRHRIVDSIDKFLLASILWFLSFAAFAISYLLILSLDDLIDIKQVSVDNGFTVPGFLTFIETAGESAAAPGLFLVGMALLIAGTWKTIMALHRLAPHLQAESRDVQGQKT